MDYTRIPEEMKQLNQWVCTWNNSKVPMRAFELVEKKAASPTDRSTWGTFEQATDAVEKGEYDQIGFVFADNGLVGIDIDVGFDDGLLTPLCVDIIKRCGSYTEKSRSGRGVHIILKGDLPFPGRNNLKGVEIYKSRRFFITTGKQILYRDVVENQEAIDYVVETYFKDIPRESKNKPLVQKIYSPVWQKPVSGHVQLLPDYPEVLPGGRNLSLTSLAGAMWNAGFNKKEIYTELCRANQKACKPPLATRELESICNSIVKYERKG